MNTNQKKIGLVILDLKTMNINMNVNKILFQPFKPT